MTTQPELHQRIVDSVTTAWPDLRFVADDLGHLMLAARDQHIEHLEQRITELEGAVARVRQAVDAGPVGSCCAHLIHAALNPALAVKRCGCGRPDPGPCQPCPDGSPSLHCACECTPATDTG
ncbi:hypothetical protein ACIA71_01885 [Streptomyces anulatus]